jgi:hypothetical protein
MSYTLGSAARATGKSKATIHRAIKSGRLSASRTESGGWLIDAAELARVFPETGETGSETATVRQSATASGAAGTALGPFPGTAALERLLAEREETIRRLWNRIEADAEERRRLLALLTGPRVPWWRHWFR